MFLLLLFSACTTETGIVDGNDGNTDTDVVIDPTTHDADHDGVVDAVDCAPEDAAIFNGADERCDTIDNDCDGKVDEGFDEDDDGYWDIQACYQLDGIWDCNDDNADVYPGADEICDGLDNDCNGLGDETDADNDTYTACEDCDDEDPFSFAGAAEACDGKDNDCDGQVDEVWDEDGDGWSPCNGDCNDEDPSFSPSAGEPCDGIDNNCDGLIDEPWDLDADGVSVCEGDCDDTNAVVYLGATEACDGYDNDCDASTDEAVDGDGDGYTVCTGDCDDSSSSASPVGSESCDDLDNDCDGYADNLESCWSCTSSSGYLLCTTTADWATADEVCVGLGYDLVHIGSAAENTSTAAIAVTPTWIGANDIDVEGDWVWSDGASVSYDNWATDEPDDSGDADCAITNNGGRRGDWADTRCSTSYQFMCEI